MVMVSSVKGILELWEMGVMRWGMIFLQLSWEARMRRIQVDCTI